MKTKLFLLFTVLAALCQLAAQETSYQTWSMVLDASDLEWSTFQEVCPNFPEQTENAEKFTQAIISWNSRFPNEVIAFYSLEKVKALNPSKYYLGLPLDENEGMYENSFIQWIKESKISDRRMMEVVPHFPDMTLDNESFNFEIDRWQQLYSHEYENLINAKELTALNPDYDGFIDLVEYPGFMGGLESKDRPVLVPNSSKEEILAFELKLMNWIFVFDAQNFRKTYGFDPKFPEDFSVERYRSAIIAKIDESKRQIELGNFETH